MLLVANNQYSVPLTLILNLASDGVSVIAVPNITRFAAVAVVLATGVEATYPSVLLAPPIEGPSSAK